MNKTNATFGQAVSALNEGKMVAREGWNGKGLKVFRQVPATIDGEIIPKMQSLPDSVKEELVKRTNEDGSIKPINYSNQLALLNPDNSVNGWAPSVSDTLANDWVIFDYEDGGIYTPGEEGN